ncbi:hypothetical protein HPB47_019788 [Ixodes persulcatus]|uniref:Uncharacterized protein n=1 Tax=Ixodes persulcatus TaxID=34615 RepID=A0AC60QH97_IXOPE|nr:hypothetical protein HPB47_019788 [Ixodes persulcatus]
MNVLKKYVERPENDTQEMFCDTTMRLRLVECPQLDGSTLLGISEASFLGKETGEGAKRRLHSSARHFLSHGATSRWHRRQGASSSPACLSPFRSPEDPAPRLLTKMAAATLPLPGPVSKPATRGIQSRTEAADPCRQAVRISS